MKRSSLLKSNRGSVLMQVLVAVGLSVLVVLILGQMTMLMNRQITYAQLKISLFEIRSNLLSIIVNDAAWKNTIEHPDNLVDPTAALCLTGTNGDTPPPVDCSNVQLPLTVVDSSGDVVLKKSTPTAGMTRQGVACDTFDGAAGNSQCPIRVTARWETDCVSPCNMRVVPLKINVSFEYNDPQAPSPINTKLLNFVLRR